MRYNMANDYEIFEGKSLSDLFQDIYENTKTNKTQLEVLMKEVVGFIKDGDTAVQIIPMLKEYLEINEEAATDLQSHSDEIEDDIKRVEN